MTTFAAKGGKYPSIASYLEEALGSQRAHSLSSLSKSEYSGLHVYIAGSGAWRLGQNRRAGSVIVCALDPREQKSRSELKRQLVKLEARESPPPLIFLVSMKPELELVSEYASQEDSVFVIDRRLVDQAARLSHGTALSLAIREKLRPGKASALMVSPYVGQIPAQGSSFFGRSRELRRLSSTLESYAVIGARMIGKTSLLMQTRQLLQDRGEDIVYIDAQACKTFKDVDNLLLGQMNPHRQEYAIARSAVLNEDIFRSVIHGHVKKGGGRTTLIIDELGVVLARLGSLEWQRFGVIRELIMAGKIRLLFSCFQEFNRKQVGGFLGPFVNSLRTLRLGMFTKREVHEFFFEPLAMLGKETDVKGVVDNVWNRLGGHPYLLQVLGQHLFEALGDTPNARAVDLVRDALGERVVEVFQEPVYSLFHEAAPPILQLVFLEAGKEIQESPKRRWKHYGQKEIIEFLDKHGIHCTLTRSMEILRGLEMFGFFARSDQNSPFNVVCPAVYSVVMSLADNRVNWLIEAVAEEARRMGSNDSE